MMMTNRNITTIIKQQTGKGKEPQGLTFPCKYPVKAMGINTNKFLQEMLFIAQKHCPQTSQEQVSTTVSRTGKYQSVTIIVEVDSRKQLETLYIELKQHIDVKWTL